MNRIVYLAIAAACIALLAASAGVLIRLPDLWALVMMAAGGMGLWALAARVADPEDAGFLRWVVVGTVGLRAVFSLAQHTLLSQFYAPEGTPLNLFGSDGMANYAAGCQLADAWRAGSGASPWPRTLGDLQFQAAPTKTALLCYLFGRSPLLGEAFTIVLNSSVCLPIYLIAKRIGCTPLARRAAVGLCAFLPSLMFWSTQDLKDPVLATCAAWGLLGLMGLLGGGVSALGYAVAWLGAGVLGIVYRPYAGLLLVMGQGLAGAAAMRLPPTPIAKIARAALFLTLAPVALWLGTREMKETYGESMGLSWATQTYRSFRQRALAEGGSVYEIPLDASTPGQAILQLPLRVVLLLLTPIPLFPGPLRRMMTYPEMWFLYLFVVPRLVYGLREAFRKNPAGASAVLLSVAPIIGAYALKTALSGEAIRMRTQFLPELFIFAGIGYALIKQRVAARAGPLARAASLPDAPGTGRSTNRLRGRHGADHPERHNE